MDELLFEVLKVVILVCVALVTRYLVPWIKGKIGQDKLDAAKTWVDAAVLMAQQVYYAKTGPERKEIVIDLLHNMLLEKNISITDEQLDTLIEAAVKAMKMKEYGTTAVVVSNTEAEKTEQ